MTTGMNFAGAGDKVRRLVANKKPQQQQVSALAPDPLRDNVIDDAANASARFRPYTTKRPNVEYEVEREDGTTETRTYDWTGFPTTVKDVARANWSLDLPELARPEEVLPSHRLGREVMNQYVHSEAFRESWPYTSGSDLESLFGAMAATDDLIGHAKGVLAEHVARSEQMAEQEQAEHDAQQLIDNLRQQAQQQQQDTGEIDPSIAQQMKGAIAQRQQARANLGQLVQQQAQSNYVQAAAEAGKSAAAAANAAAKLASMLPGTEAGQARNLPLDKQVELAQKWSGNATMIELVQELGRKIESMTHKRQTRTENVPIEPVSVMTGRDIERMLPHELARAYDPVTRPLWMKDFAEGKLLQYRMHGKMPAAKGRLITVHDGSGSMTADLGGVSRFVWASSLGLAVVTIAHREGRSCAGIEFGSKSQLKTWLFPANEDLDPDALLDYGSHFYGGGTSTVTGMKEALRLIREEPDFDTADIILIGDGADTFGTADAAIRRDLEKLNVRVHGVSIATPNNKYMASMCDYTVDVTDLASGRDATDALAERIT